MSGERPQGWTMATLDEIAEINPRHPVDLDAALPVTFVPMPAVSENNWAFQFTEERPLGEVRKGYTHFAEGDVLFAKITPCMENGKAAVATELKNGLGCGSTELHVLRPCNGIQPKFIYHFLHQESFRQEAARNFTGTAGQLRVPVSFIREAIIPLPPLNEQRRIVAKLEKLLDKVSASQKRLARILIFLKRFRQSVLAAACSGSLTKDWSDSNPHEDWKHVTIEEVAQDIDYGYTAKATQDRSGVKFLRITDIQGGKVDWDEVPFCHIPVSRFDHFSLTTGDIVFARTGATTGKSFLIKSCPKVVFASYLIRVRAGNHVTPEFLYLFFQSTEYWRQISEDISGSAQPSFNATKLANLSLVLPTLAEQQEIVRRVEALFAVADKIEARYTKAKTQVDKLTQSILAKAFRGELVPQDPNDEPANILLKRIKPIKNRFVDRKRRK